MTRVNLIDPKILTDQHLNAERVELTMAFSSARRSLHSRNGLRVGDKFTLNSGHVIFFHNKIGYLKDRFFKLSNEMISRGMHPRSPWPDDSWVRSDMWGTYEASEDDFKIVKTRIRERLLKKPSWYRFHKTPISLEWINTLYPEAA